MKLKILFLTTTFPYPPHSGYKDRCFNIIRFLSRKNSIYLLSFIQNKKEKKFLEKLSDYCQEQYAIDGAKVTNGMIIKSLCSRTPFHVMNHKNKEFLKTFNSLLQRIKPDIIYSNHLYFAQYLHAFPRFNKPLLVLDQHALNRDTWIQTSRSHSNLFYRLYAKLEFMKTKSFENKSYLLFDICFCCSEEERTKSEKLWKGPTFLLAPNGVDTSYFNPFDSSMSFSISPEDIIGEYPVLLFTGTKASRNREAIKYFYLKIWPLIRNERPDVIFLIAGNINRRDLPFIEKNDKKVYITGPVSDIRPYFKFGTIYIAPFLLGGGTKLKILQAMAMAKPIVSTPTGICGIPLINGKDVLIANNPKDFARAVIQLLDKPEMRERLAGRARKKAIKNFEWRKIVHNIDTAIKDHLTLYPTRKFSKGTSIE
jgi:glycosyltransferase involved in cell wall biosynthesis